jgi:uncharacterized protein (DUF1330 family)
MAKGYWIATYRSVSDPQALARYAKLATPIFEAHGGRFLARGSPARVYEAAEAQRCVVIEFPSVAAAISMYESPEYREARSVLKGAAEREIRIVEGIEHS